MDRSNKFCLESLDMQLVINCSLSMLTLVSIKIAEWKKENNIDRVT